VKSQAEPDGKARGQGAGRATEEEYATGYGKAILLGEHAVVYGRHAIAVPVPMAIRARVEDSNDGAQLLIPRWGVEQRIQPGSKQTGVFQSLELILERLELAERSMRIQVYPNIPRASGLGGSAALAVAVIRALDRHFKLGLADERISELSYECE